MTHDIRRCSNTGSESQSYSPVFAAGCGRLWSALSVDQGSSTAAQLNEFAVSILRHDRDRAPEPIESDDFLGFVKAPPVLAIHRDAFDGRGFGMS